MSNPGASLLPVHGFVLAGGKSLRMGRDKALVPIEGQSMAERALSVLRSFCKEVSIAGNRSDLRYLAPVVHEVRTDAGPAAGIEAGLEASEEAWALFIPVDVPLIPPMLLSRWAEAVLEHPGHAVRLSYLVAEGRQQPAFCMLHKVCLAPLGRVLDSGERKLAAVFERVAAEVGQNSLLRADAESFASVTGNGMGRSVAACFRNVNTPEDLAALLESARGSVEYR